LAGGPSPHKRRRGDPLRSPLLLLYKGLFTEVRGIGILGSSYTRSCISAALSYPNADLNKGDVSGGTGALIPRCMDIRRRASQTSTSLRSPMGRPSAGDTLYRYMQSTPRTPLSPGPMPQSQAALTFAQWGTPPDGPPFPSVLVSKHTPSIKKSPIWARKRSLI
jgi:hypothetical protein